MEVHQIGQLLNMLNILQLSFIYTSTIIKKKKTFRLQPDGWLEYICTMIAKTWIARSRTNVCEECGLVIKTPADEKMTKVRKWVENQSFESKKKL